MAGIGFELRKITNQGKITSFFEATITGIMIVAGPWIFSIIGITITQKLFALTSPESPRLFLGVLIYTYAGSMILWSGIQYLFTRAISDYLFHHQQRRAATLLVKVCIVMLPVSFLIALGAMLPVPLTVQNPFLFRLSAALFFGTISVIWILMMFISLLKWYFRILICYLLGMGCGAVIVWAAAPLLGVTGMLLGFTIGHAIIAIGLLGLSLHRFKPIRFKIVNGRMRQIYQSNKHLFFIGLFLSMGIWGDKIVYWFFRGSAPGNTWFYLFDPYDIAVYYANLFIIPGLLYFTIFTETEFHIYLKKFLLSLNGQPLIEIRKRKYQLKKATRKVMTDQSVFIGMMIMILLISAEHIINFLIPGLTTPLIFRMALCGLFLYFPLITIMNFMFYLQIYTVPLLAVILFFGINTAVAITTAGGFWNLPPGFSYIASLFVADLFILIRFNQSMKKLDQIIFLQ